MTLTIRPFTGDHLQRLNYGQIENEIIPHLALNDFYPGMAVSLFDGTIVMGCLGVIPLSDRNLQGWALFSDELRAKPIALHRQTLRCLKLFNQLIDCNALFVTVRANFSSGRVWLERLGFTFDQVLENYGPNNQQYYRYIK